MICNLITEKLVSTKNGFYSLEEILTNDHILTFNDLNYPNEGLQIATLSWMVGVTQFILFPETMQDWQFFFDHPQDSEEFKKITQKFNDTRFENTFLDTTVTKKEEVSESQLKRLHLYSNKFHDRDMKCFSVSKHILVSMLHRYYSCLGIENGPGYILPERRDNFYQTFILSDNLRKTIIANILSKEFIAGKFENMWDLEDQTFPWEKDDPTYVPSNNKTSLMRMLLPQNRRVNFELAESGQCSFSDIEKDVYKLTHFFSPNKDAKNVKDSNETFFAIIHPHSPYYVNPKDKKNPIRVWKIKSSVPIWLSGANLWLSGSYIEGLISPAPIIQQWRESFEYIKLVVFAECIFDLDGSPASKGDKYATFSENYMFRHITPEVEDYVTTLVKKTKDSGYRLTQSLEKFKDDIKFYERSFWAQLRPLFLDILSRIQNDSPDIMSLTHDYFKKVRNLCLSIFKASTHKLPLSESVKKATAQLNLGRTLDKILK